jgi:hypothetical protein
MEIPHMKKWAVPNSKQNISILTNLAELGLNERL